jgi:hypothetical protein
LTFVIACRNGKFKLRSEAEKLCDPDLKFEIWKFEISKISFGSGDLGVRRASDLSLAQLNKPKARATELSWLNRIAT